ncbi:glycosyltransferase family 9 protein [Enterobacteriaceae bacterium H20N1]|uniref:Glycosyltransferase family 9 protein n=1 Tax=Dryocola boscaweniae TaxID=2925397 RepID=A0A9X2W4D0_9ENTR|nr:glycosyltransferase family 9 protein [Dryocola boscaweniae]MCT4700815.1 glycosyltransferase family 9 protein [Dryocola boscaweniae]MCT4717980.1 glycosyltransferase family 9 protein [Dryocola boscaweniae]
MSYLFIFILLLPFKLIGKLFYKKTGRNLMIQTAKIGDFVNVTPLLAHLKHSDVLISKTVLPLAKNDETIDTIFLIEEHKKSLWGKFRLAFKLMNRYENVYLLQPNSTNLFFAAACNAANKQFLSTYTRRWYHGLFYWTASGVVEHSKDQLTVDDYLKLADRNLTWRDSPKHATFPLRKPKAYPAELDKQNVIKIGLSISAGNKSKTIPPIIWKKIFKTLANLNCNYYIFGPKNEQVWLDDLYREIDEQDNIISLIGKLPLEDVPFAISKMDFYIASDSGNVYIADAVGVPIILIYGPCCIAEQRPLGEVLLLGNRENEKSYIFEAPYFFDRSREELFALSDEDLIKIHHFIVNR